MVEYIIYIANDGEEFETAEECIDWEYRISHLPSSIHWYTEDETPLVPTCEAEMLSFYNHKDFTHCIVDNVPNWSQDLAFMRDYWGFLMPPAPGDWYWDKRAGWEDWSIK